MSRFPTYHIIYLHVILLGLRLFYFYCSIFLPDTAWAPKLIEYFVSVSRRNAKPAGEKTTHISELNIQGSSMK